jgi:putative oxidoreductase
MRLKDSYLEFTVLTNFFRSFSLLFVRLALAYGFYTPALLKWSNFDSTVEWFVTLGIPFATLSAFIAASVETIAILLLFLGLFTRFISIPLMVIMLVAIALVHLTNGFSVVNNGFEIPLYYFLFLSILVTQGAGKFSLDYLFYGKGR